MKKFQPGYYTADTLRGVEYDNNFLLGSPDAEVLSPRDFIDALDTLGDSEIIVTALDYHHEELWDEINTTGAGNSPLQEGIK